MELRIKVAYIYRAHWRAGMCPPKYEPVVASARRGLELLSARRGVIVGGLSAADWGFLISLCDAAVGAEYARGAASAVFTAAVREARDGMDRFVAAVIEWCAAGCSGPEVGVQRAGVAAAEGSDAYPDDDTSTTDTSAGACRATAEAASDCAIRTRLAAVRL